MSTPSLRERAQRGTRSIGWAMLSLALVLGGPAAADDIADSLAAAAPVADSLTAAAPIAGPPTIDPLIPASPESLLAAGAPVLGWDYEGARALSSMALDRVVENARGRALRRS